MREFEILIEDINPCGGNQFAKREIIEAEAESPEAYVAANGRFPVIDQRVNPSGDIVITTGDGHGNLVKYTFTE